MNFAGLGDIELTGLNDRSEIFFAGRNGIGKSQLLLAIAIPWRLHRGPEYHKYIGPSASTARLTVEYAFDGNDINSLVKVADEMHQDHQDFVGDSVSATIELSRLKHPHTAWTADASGNRFGNVLGDWNLRSELPFAAVTYLPADRYIDRSAELTMSLASLARSKTDEIGASLLDQVFDDWNQVHNFDVFSSLTALHYAGLLSTSHGGEASQQKRDFGDITRAFESATGKAIGEPLVKADGSIALEVSLPNGDTHPIRTLSSGELVALQLMHFIRLHHRQGSILLVDEPEQHLHPSLQVEIVESVRRSSSGGQMIMATHSPNVLNVVPTSSIVVLGRNATSGRTMAKFADEESDRIQLLQDLGVAPGLWTPGNFIVIVEGPTDENYLRRLFANHMGSAYFVVAGSSLAVRSLADRMSKASQNAALPYIAVLDRDAADQTVRAAWNESPAQFMWRGYAIESIFLDPALIHATLERAGSPMALDAVETELTRVFARQRESARARFVRAKVESAIPTRNPGDLLVTEHFAAQGAVAQERVNWFRDHKSDLDGEFEAAWSSETLGFVEPKRALNEFNDGKVFRTSAARTGASMAALVENPGLAPADLVDLLAKLEAIT